MVGIICFVAGLFVGALVATLIMALFAVGKDAGELEHELGEK